jgi:hypothetical protein
MLIRNLFLPWRQNVALHATLDTKEIIRVDNATRDLVQLDNAEPEPRMTSAKIKFLGKTSDGIEVYVNIELIGPPHRLQQFKFTEGKHVGMVLRAID